MRDAAAENQGSHSVHPAVQKRGVVRPLLTAPLAAGRTAGRTAPDRAAQPAAEPAGFVAWSPACYPAGLHPRAGWDSGCDMGGQKPPKRSLPFQAQGIPGRSCLHKPAIQCNSKNLPKITILNCMQSAENLMHTDLGGDRKLGCTPGCTPFGCCTAKRTSLDPPPLLKGGAKLFQTAPSIAMLPSDK
jgi:hypothetical protein